MSFESLQATPSGPASPANHPNKQGQKAHVRSESVSESGQDAYKLPTFMNCLRNASIFFGITAPKMFINAGNRETASLATLIREKNFKMTYSKLFLPCI